MKRHCKVVLLCLALAMGGAAAADVALIGVIGGKAAVLAVEGGDPKTVKVGQKWNGITVLSVEKDRATVEIDGKRRVLIHGQHYRSESAMRASRESVTLAADARGHFFTDGAINGVQQRFLVDTGASVVVLASTDAARMGLDYRKGALAVVQTANGTAEAHRIKLDSVRVGDITLSSVEAVVIHQAMPVALLGMSFLNRVEMKRDGPNMVLTRRF